MITSSEEVYRRLCLKNTESILSFEVLALAVFSDGELDKTKLRSLIQLLRPERDGSLKLVGMSTTQLTRFSMRLLFCSHTVLLYE